MSTEQHIQGENTHHTKVLVDCPICKLEVAQVESLWDDTNKDAKPSPPPDLVVVDTLVKGGSEGDGTAPTASTERSRAFYASRTFPDDPQELYFRRPSHVHAAVVTCGGLCPGLNNVVREITYTLYTQYRAARVYGIQGGWHGFQDAEYPPVLLTLESVRSIHHEGGSFLRTSRGGLDLQKVVRFIHKYQIKHLYILGGDGTHRAAYQVHEICRSQTPRLDVAVVGIPKTIDNDLDYIDRSFGFWTAVEASQASIRTAFVESKCTVPNGIGVIKLMGREAGFLAAYAALGSGGDVDLVLVPEVPIDMDEILPFLQRRVLEKQYAVVVVAEGAGQELLAKEYQTSETEAGSGNKKLPPIAEYVRDRIKQYFKDQSLECRMKYVDPSYSVRSVPANAADSYYCMQLGQAAVHGAMAGYTGFSVGMVQNRIVYIPIPQLVSTSPRTMDPNGDTWQRVLAMTGQPNPTIVTTATTATTTATTTNAK